MEENTALQTKKGNQNLKRYQAGTRELADMMKIMGVMGVMQILLSLIGVTGLGKFTFLSVVR